MSEAIATTYEELKLVDQDLHRAEQNLLAAHLNRACTAGPRPQEIYLTILLLRAKTKALLRRLADDLISD